MNLELVSNHVSVWGEGPIWLRINGERIQPAAEGKKMNDLREFAVPRPALQHPTLTLSWEFPPGAKDLPWREQPRLAEVWLIKK